MRDSDFVINPLTKIVAKTMPIKVNVHSVEPAQVLWTIVGFFVRK